MGDPPYALTPVEWAGAVEDETMFKKKQLLPKDLAARAEKVDPAKVEAEVLRILSAPPGRGQTALSPMDPHFVPGWRAMLQPGSIVPVSSRQAIAQEAAQLQQAYTAEMRSQLDSLMGLSSSMLRGF